MTRVLTIDVGATASKCAVFDPAGPHIVAARIDDPGNPNVLGAPRAESNLSGIALRLTLEAECTPDDIDTVVVGISTPSVAHAALAPIFAHSRLLCVSDTELPGAGLGVERVVALVSGTGSEAVRLQQGSVLGRAGGWGWLLGDEGSATAIGRAAVRAVLIELEGGRTTALRDRIAEHIDASSTVELRDALFAWVYQRGIPVHRLGSLAPLVTEAAEQGDPVADEIASNAANALVVLANRVRVDGDAIAMGGGVAAALADRITAACRRTDLPEPHIMRDGIPGAYSIATGAGPEVVNEVRGVWADWRRRHGYPV